MRSSFTSPVTPANLFPSTCRLWRGLDEVQSLQRPNHEGLEDYVVECFQRMYAAFHRAAKEHRSMPDRRCPLRRPDREAQSKRCAVSTKRLRLGDFDSVQPIIENWVESEHRSYKTNRHQLPPEQDAMIHDAWRDYFETYHYG